MASAQSRLAMSDRLQRQPTRPTDLLEPVQAGQPRNIAGAWSTRLVLFMRIMAVLSLIKGVYHWTQICGIGVGAGDFEARSVAWQTATVFFAVIDLVAAVGLWLAAAWGAVVWLTAVVSMAVVEVFFPQVYGGSIYVVLGEVTLLGLYMWLAVLAARERPA
jgi:hypothetical protein